MGFLVFILWMFLNEETTLAAALGMWVLATVLAAIALFAEEETLAHYVTGGTYLVLLLGLMLLNVFAVIRDLCRALRYAE